MTKEEQFKELLQKALTDLQFLQVTLGEAAEAAKELDNEVATQHLYHYAGQCSKIAEAIEDNLGEDDE